jgi:hypothetical protein
LRNELYRRICEDETELNKFPLLDSLMSLATDVSNAWIKTLWLADGGHYNQAQVLGQSLVTLLSDKDERKTDWQAYLQLLELQELWEQDSIVVLDSTQAQMLEGWMDENLPHTFGLALNILTRYSDYIYYEPLNYGEPLENRSLQFSTAEDKTPNWLMLYPNPTSGLTYLRLTSAPLTTSALLRVVDPLGKVIVEINLARQNFEYPMDFTTLATGTYQIQILDQEQSIYRSALIKL